MLTPPLARRSIPGALSLPRSSAMRTRCEGIAEGALRSAEAAFLCGKSRRQVSGNKECSFTSHRIRAETMKKTDLERAVKQNSQKQGGLGRNRRRGKRQCGETSPDLGPILDFVA